jgi:hypothetical protein
VLSRTDREHKVTVAGRHTDRAIPPDSGSSLTRALRIGAAACAHHDGDHACTPRSPP